MKEYQTVAQYAFAEFIERKSRFIGHIAPVSSEQDAFSFLERIQKEHHDATHNVFAWRLKTGATRCSDNGEPQGTAGVPTLDVLQRENITDVCLVVTRYFGGILLGAGGLVRAYAHAAKLAVDAASIVSMRPCVSLNIACDYSFYGKLSYVLPDFHAKVLESRFGSDISLDVLLLQEEKERFKNLLTELSNGQVKIRKIGESYGNL